MRATQPQLITERSLPSGQLLKWIGSKYRSALEIVSHFPQEYGLYYEPFVGGGAVLGTLAPARAVAGDTLEPLIQLWRAFQQQPDDVIAHYRETWLQYRDDRERIYKERLAAYNASPNPFDLLFICRSCYGGVVRFTKKGTMSTPLGAHLAISPDVLQKRLDSWRPRLEGVEFLGVSFEKTMAAAGANDLVYCDPPYTHAQSILYGSQAFELERLWSAVADAAGRGAKVAVSIDGYKHSGNLQSGLQIPRALFKRRVVIHKGGSMLKRFQRRDLSVSDEQVGDRLLLTW